MQKNSYFRYAEWIRFDDSAVSVDAVKEFDVQHPASASIRIIGFGFFELFLNGKKVSEDRFLPLNTDFHARDIVYDSGAWTEQTAHRVYVTSYDIVPYLNCGKNVLAVRLGNGWYADDYQLKFGEKKLIFEICLTDTEGNKTYVVSDESVQWRTNFITGYRLTRGENHDYRGYDDCFDLSCGNWKNAVVTDIPPTEYLTTDCPADRCVESIVPVIIRSEIGRKVYDIGINTSGNAVLKLKCRAGETVRLICSEEKTDGNDIDPDRVWGQISEFIGDGNEREVSLHFTWNACRYFAVEGNADVIRFDRIFTNVPCASSFSCSDEVVQWIYDAYVNTQLSNMHSGIPSDCPHLERRGYTGDGELAAHAAMTVLDAKPFYTKWISDISDCQDRISGHVQYTAPYTHSGGGPGGWGCAIVHMPYEYYRHYGDVSFMKDLYPQMKEYFRFLDEHSENGLIVSDVPGEWCLGDWCTARRIAIPAPFVNVYFYIRSLNEILELADKIGLDNNEIAFLLKKKAYLEKVLCDNYFDPATGDFAENVQCANVFAVDLGLGDDRTYSHVTERYRASMMFDTGIFGTDILIRTLFRKGDPDLAFGLLASDKMFSFGHIKEAGATTLWEYWTGKRSRSHPMFGAVAAYLFEYILGIRLSAGKILRIEPLYIGCNACFEGELKTTDGQVSVKISYAGTKASFDITVEKETDFIYNGVPGKLSAGRNVFETSV